MGQLFCRYELCESLIKRHFQKEDRELDPFKRLDSVAIEMILKHLTGRDILSASEVSTVWNREIAKSEVALSKIKLNVIESENWTVDIVKSRRKYQNLLVFSRNKKDVIVALAGSLVELYVKSYDANVNGLVMPNLQKLVFDGDATVNGLLNCARNLQELHIKSIRSPASGTIIRCLKVNKNLKILSLGLSPSMIFRQDLSPAYKLRLTSLTAKLFLISNLSNFLDFLCSQADSLQRLSIDVKCCNSHILKTIINRLYRLEVLEIYTSPDPQNLSKPSPPHDLPKGLKYRPFLIPNKSIKTLRIDRLRLQDLMLLKILLQGLPNLTQLRVLDSTTKAFLLTLENAQKLTEFRTLLFTVIIVHDDVND